MHYPALQAAVGCPLLRPAVAGCLLIIIYHIITTVTQRTDEHNTFSARILSSASAVQYEALQHEEGMPSAAHISGRGDAVVWKRRRLHFPNSSALSAKEGQSFTDFVFISRRRGCQTVHDLACRSQRCYSA